MGKCFHPQCGKIIIAGRDQNSYEHTLHKVLEEIYGDLHATLVALKDAAGHNAYSYLVDERKIHPRVVSDSMLGAIPAGGYYPEDKFQQEIDRLKVEIEKEKTLHTSKKHRRRGITGEERLELLIAAKEKLYICLNGRAGWLAFFYTDSLHRIVAIRFREPYSHRFVYFKPFENVAGLFGHGLFSPYQFQEWKALNDLLIVTEGEFNQLQIQSLSVRIGEAEEHDDPGYVYSCAVGGVDNADFNTIKRIARSPIIGYDNDSDHAGFALVERAQERMSVTAFTTPLPDSDPDSYIRSFNADYENAWRALKELVASRKPYPRTYSEIGVEFLRGDRFIPKRLAEAITETHYFKFAGEALWVYRNGVYRPGGEKVVRIEAQRLLGEERLEKHINETIKYIETASNSEPEPPDASYINMLNGRLDISTGLLEEHTPEKFEVAQIPIKYDPTALCPNFDRYLSSTFDAEVIPLVEEIYGYSLIPDTQYEKAVMLVGSGKNGKSVFLDALTELLGIDNVSSESLHDLEENRFRVANLYGKLANICADLGDRELKSSELFKKIVTGDSIAGERKHRDSFSFRPHARLLFSANALPSSKDGSYAFYRRWIIIPFNKTFKGKQADRKLRVKLRSELPGIFNRALSGLRRLLSNEQFTEPAVVMAALKAYKQQNDSAIAFIAACIQPLKDSSITKQQLYSSYKCWCDEQGFRYADQRHFGESLRNTFPEIDEWRADAGHGKWHWLGIRLTNDAPRPGSEAWEQ